MSPTKRIERLTPDQELDLQRTYVEWLTVGQSTAPLDEAAARDVIGQMYGRINEPAPVVLFFSSPLMCVLAYGALRTLAGAKGNGKNQTLRSQLWSQLGSQLRSQLWSQLGSQLRSQLGSQLWSQLTSQLGSQLRSQLGWQLRSQLESQLESQLGSQLGSQLRSQLGSQLESQLRSQLGSQLGSQLRSQLGSQLWSQLRSQLESQLESQLRSQLRSQLDSELWSQLGSQYFAGSQWCAWEVFYDFCRRIGVRYTGDENALLDLWLTQSRTCHWWWPYKGLVLASRRPSVLAVDAEGRLHAPDGPALAYTDGWAIYAWHGVRVDEVIITKPATLTPQQIQDEPNAEVRRVMLERFGFDRFLHDSGALPIHADEIGTLYRCELAGDEPLILVRVMNSTPEPDGHSKHYVLRVPPDMTQARQAIAWTFGKDADAYRPSVET